jgi:hypothetical protein
MIGKLAAAMALFVVPLPAMAQDGGMIDIDGWSIAPVAPRVCQAAGAFKGSTVLSFIDSDSNPGMIALVDSDLALTEGAVHAAQVSWDGGKTSTPLKLKAGKASNGLWTLTTLTDRDFSQRTRQAKGVTIRVPSLNLNGSVKFTDAVLTALSDCIRKG